MYFNNLFLTALLWVFISIADVFRLFLILKIVKNDRFYIKREIYYAAYIICASTQIVCILLRTPYSTAAKIQFYITIASLFLAINDRLSDRIWTTFTIFIIELLLSVGPLTIFRYRWNINDEIIDLIYPFLVTPFLILVYSIRHRSTIFNKFLDKYCIQFIKYTLLISALFQTGFALVMTDRHPNSLLISNISFTIALLLCVLTLYFLNIHNKITQMSAEQQELLTTQKEYYLALLEKEEETRKYRHDMNNHLMCLSALVETENIPEIRVYLSNLQNQFRSVNDSVYQTGNTILTAITAHYIPMADENTKVTITGKLTKDLDLSNTDLCTVYSNLIKNSIEELQRIDRSVHKELNIRFDTGNHFGKICVSNSMKDPSAFKGLASKTVKDDKANHGFGIQNINRVVAKNKGTFDIKKENEQFCCEVVLPTVSEKAG